MVDARILRLNQRNVAAANSGVVVNQEHVGIGQRKLNMVVLVLVLVSLQSNLKTGTLKRHPPMSKTRE